MKAPSECASCIKYAGGVPEPGDRKGSRYCSDFLISFFVSFFAFFLHFPQALPTLVTFFTSLNDPAPPWTARRMSPFVTFLQGQITLSGFILQHQRGG